MLFPVFGFFPELLFEICKRDLFFLDPHPLRRDGLQNGADCDLSHLFPIPFIHGDGIGVMVSAQQDPVILRKQPDGPQCIFPEGPGGKKGAMGHNKNPAGFLFKGFQTGFQKSVPLRRSVIQKNKEVFSLPHCIVCHRKFPDFCVSGDLRQQYCPVGGFPSAPGFP